MTKIYLMQKWILVFLLASSALLFNPFINTDVFEFPKILAFILSIGILTLVNIIDIYKNGWPPEINLKPVSKEFCCFVILFFSQMAAYIFSTDREISLMGAVPRYQGLLINIHYILLALNTFYFFRKYKDNKSNDVSKWFSIILIIVCITAVLPYVFPLTFPFYFFTPAFFFNRVYSTFGNPNYLAVFIIGTLPFLIFRKNLKNIYYYSGVLLVIITLFLTGSRSAWIASILGFLITGILLAFKLKKYKTLSVTSIVIILLAAAIGIKAYIAPIIPQFERLSLDTPQSTSIQTRSYLWKSGLKMSLKRPITGYGQDMIQENIEPYLPEYLKSNEKFFVDRTHNEFIDILLFSGIFAFLSYFCLLVLILWRSARINVSEYVIGPFTAFISLIIFHTVNFSTTSSNILLYFSMGYLIAAYINAATHNVFD